MFFDHLAQGYLWSQEIDLSDSNQNLGFQLNWCQCLS
jgi:hypothetical protein